MENPHYHLLLNHFPIIGLLICVLFLTAGFLFKNKTVKMISAALIFMVGILAIFAHQSGEAAEEVVEHLPGVSHKMVHAHADAAGPAMICMNLTSLFALIYLFMEWKQKKMSGIFSILLLLSALTTFGLMARAGNIGGKIRHTEILENNQNQTQEEVEDHLTSPGGHEERGDDH